VGAGATAGVDTGNGSGVVGTDGRRGAGRAVVGGAATAGAVGAGRGALREGRASAGAVRGAVGLNGVAAGSRGAGGGVAAGSDARAVCVCATGGWPRVGGDAVVDDAVAGGDAGGVVGAGVPRAPVCTARGGANGEGDEGFNRKITADSPRKPTAIAPAPYATILPIDDPSARGCDCG